MKQYILKHSSIVEGKPLAEGALVKLADDKAKPYKDAGIIEEVKEDKEDAKAAKDAKAEAKKIDTSDDKRVEKSQG